MRYKLLFILFLATVTFAQSYRVGDVITNPDGSKGVVFYVNPDGSGGGMVALNDATNGCTWGTLNDNVPNLQDINSYHSFFDYEGYSNTKKILDHQGSGTGYAASFVDFKNSWYLPSVSQMNVLYGMAGVVSPVLVTNGGSMLNNAYWTSCEFSSDMSIFMGANGVAYLDYKTSQYAVRAIRDFTTQKIDYDTTLTYNWNTGSIEPFIRVSPDTTTTYTVTATTSAGCSVTISKTIIANNAAGQIINDTICEGEVYNKHGFSETTTGTYTQTVTQGGCSAIVTLNLTVNPTYQKNIKDTICLGETYIQNGFNITPYQTGNYTQIFHYNTKHGCDSLITVDLFVLPTYTQTINDTICQNQNYNKHGFNLPVQTVAGLHPQTLRLTSHKGCDSIIVLNLFVKPTYNIIISDQVCPDKAYLKYNFNIAPQPENSLVTETKYLKTKALCDSIVILNLKVTHQISTILNEQLCEGSSYYFKGKNLTVSGIYKDTLAAAGGCDSIITLNLTVYPVRQTILYDTIYVNNGYNKNGFNFPIQHTAGDYTKTTPLKTIYNCDSIVTLHLHVNEKDPNCVSKQTVFDEAICQNQSYNKDGFNLPPQNIIGTTKYQQELYTEFGCDSTVILNLTVNKIYTTTTDVFIKKGQSIIIDGFNYSQPGIVVNTYISSSGCDSTITSVIKYTDCDPIEPDEYFTPNGDGMHDKWLVKNIECYDYTLEIYDRYGKLLARWDNNFAGWDGFYRGKPVVSTDYWYVIVLRNRNGNRIAGHFNLKR